VQARILIVDDDPSLRDIVRFALQKAGFSTLEAGDGRAALELFSQHAPDLVILDILMPELDGTEVCRRIRLTSRVPIVFLSSRDDEIDRILGLELGGDDYVTKPFSPRELVARVRAVLRRLSPLEEPLETASRRPPSQGLKQGRLRLDEACFQAFWDDTPVTLTVTEFGMLRTLLRTPGKVFRREELMDGAYEYDNVVSDRTIDSHIRRVRRKFGELGGDPIETVHGLGYRLSACR
jgi:two-component system OmpR family response regulator